MVWSEIYKELAGRIASMRPLLDSRLESLSESPPELATALASVPDIRHIDLWREQTAFNPEQTCPFATPAVLIDMNTLEVKDNSNGVQDVLLGVDLYLFWETTAVAPDEVDTPGGVDLGEDLANCLNLITALHVLFHGYTGEHFSTIRHTGVHRVESAKTGYLYRISMECSVRDYSAQELWITTQATDRELNLSAGDALRQMADEYQ